MAKQNEIAEARGLLGRLGSAFRTLRTMMRDRSYKFPLKLKLLAFIAVVYTVWPLDIIPDFLPLLGIADDSALLLGFLALLLEEVYRYEKTSPKEVPISR